MSKKNLDPAPSAPPNPTAAAPPTPKRSRSEQSRINGSKSHGPITPEGKATSSRNAIRHGLTANIHTVLADESPEQYNEALSGWVDDLRPATKTELRIVEQIANIHWRLERLAMMETALLNVEMALTFEETAQAFAILDPVGHLAAAWKASSGGGNSLELLRRYLGTLQSQFNATFKNFRTLESRREDPRRVRDLESSPPWERQLPTPDWGPCGPPPAKEAPLPSPLADNMEVEGGGQTLRPAASLQPVPPSQIVLAPTRTASIKQATPVKQYEPERRRRATPSKAA